MATISVEYTLTEGKKCALDGKSLAERESGFIHSGCSPRSRWLIQKTLKSTVFGYESILGCRPVGVLELSEGEALTCCLKRATSCSADGLSG